MTSVIFLIAVVGKGVLDKSREWLDLKPHNSALILRHVFYPEQQYTAFLK